MNLAAFLGLCLGILHGFLQVGLRGTDSAHTSPAGPAPLVSPWSGSPY